jgi:hypothetical protein
MKITFDAIKLFLEKYVGTFLIVSGAVATISAFTITNYKASQDRADIKATQQVLLNDVKGIKDDLIAIKTTQEEQGVLLTTTKNYVMDHIIKTEKELTPEKILQIYRDLEKKNQLSLVQYQR